MGARGVLGPYENNPGLLGEGKQSGEGFVDKGTSGDKDIILFRQNIFTGWIGEVSHTWVPFQDGELTVTRKRFFSIKREMSYDGDLLSLDFFRNTSKASRTSSAYWDGQNRSAGLFGAGYTSC